MEFSVWTERYRPRRLADVVGQDLVVARLRAFVERGAIPHMVFVGPPGSGKTTCAVALCNELFGEGYKENLIELNASVKRGIDTMRSKGDQKVDPKEQEKELSIKDFVSTSGMTTSHLKVVLLDEADHMTPEAQDSLRRIIEGGSSRARFILSCNYLSRIIDPIASRCAVFPFRPLGLRDVERVVSRIARDQGMTLDAGCVDALWHVSGGDLRRAINTLQSTQAVQGRITAESVYEAAGFPDPATTEEVVRLALAGQTKQALALADGAARAVGAPSEVILREIHRALESVEGPPELIAAVFRRMGAADYHLVEGCDGPTQLAPILQRLSAVGAQGGRFVPTRQGGDASAQAS